MSLFGGEKKTYRFVNRRDGAHPVSTCGIYSYFTQIRFALPSV